MNKLETAEKYSWHIINALWFKIKTLEKSVTECKATLASPENDGSAPYRSLKGLIAECEQQIAEYREAWSALREAGFR